MDSFPKYYVQNGYIIYERGKNNNSPIWRLVYNNAVAMGKNIDQIYQNDIINQEIANRLIALGNNEAIKERALIKVATGLEIEDDVGEKEFIEHFNNVLIGKQNFEKAKERIDSALKHKEVAARAPTIASWFGGYLTSSLNEQFSNFVKTDGNRQDLIQKNYSTWDKEFDEMINRAIMTAFEKMLNKMEGEEGKELYGDSETWKAYYEASQQIANFEQDFIQIVRTKMGDFENLKRMFTATKKNGKPAINLNAKKKFGFSTFIESEKGLNLGNGRKSRNVGGSIQEILTQIAQTMGTAAQNAVQSGGKTFQNEIGLADSFSIYSFERDIDMQSTAESLAESLDEVLKDSLSLSETSKIMNDYYDKHFSKLNNTFIVYNSSKSYTLSDSFRKFHAGGKRSLEILPELFENAQICNSQKAREFIYKVYNTAKYAIYQDQRAELTENMKQTIMSAMANLLFDDWQTIGEENMQGGAQCIHTLDLEGIQIPLSIFLKATGNAMNETLQNAQRFFKIDLHIIKSAKEEWAQEGGTIVSSGSWGHKGDATAAIHQAWQEQAQWAAEESYFTASFYSNFKTIIKNYL